MKIVQTLVLVLLLTSACTKKDSLKDGFKNPPDNTKPWVYWYWIDENISKEGITKDLEAMARVGVGEALIGQVSPGGKKGSVPMLSDEWWEMVAHAVRQGQELGVDIGFFNGPGWAQSGGPWIQPEEAMQYVVSNEVRITGPAVFHDSIPAPHKNFRDISLVAFPAPEDKTERPGIEKISTQPFVKGIEKLFDGDTATSFLLTGAQDGHDPFMINLRFSHAVTMRSLRLLPVKKPFVANVEFQVQGSDGQFRTLHRFTFDRRTTMLTVGPMRFAPLTIAFSPVKSKSFRLIFSNLSNRREAGFREIELSGSPVIDHYAEKQLGKMYPDPLPPWDAYLWPEIDENTETTVIDTATMIDLSDHIDETGMIRWQAPAGEWIILRTGMAPTGVKNAPAPPQATGYECDKFDKSAIRKHFEAYLGDFFENVPPEERKSLKHIIIDSYEAGSQNWSPVMKRYFIERYGYDPKPWLPVFTGRVVQNRALSNRFLWDVRRLVADLISENYVGGLREIVHEKGLKLWLENYGHWGFPGEFLQYGGQSDEVSGEFWFDNPYWNLGSIECRAASSAAHIYGKKKVFAESYTAGFNFRQTPATMKTRGDWAFANGINHSVLHVYIHQPYDDKVPGVTAWFGISFQRNNTWFDRSKVWIDYLRRCHYMLQQGRHVADVCYFIGEDTPKMTGPLKPQLPEGYDFDFINADVILNRLEVKDGWLVLPGGMRYRMMVLPPQETMRPGLLQKISELVNAGATILGSPPERSPSLRDYPACDEKVADMTREMWGTDTHKNQISYGKGMIFQGISLEEAFRRIGMQPDMICANDKILWTHRRSEEADIYFISNQRNKQVDALCSFRIDDKIPELWYAGDGHSEGVEFEVRNNRTVMSLTLPPAGSVFVVFRKNSRSLMAPAKMITDTTVTLDDPWQITFPSGWDTPEKITMYTLVSWTEYPDEGVKHFSGTASYGTTFRIDNFYDKKNRKIMLDLGEVASFAEISVNGQAITTLWKPPWTADITDAVKNGQNSLIVKVTNTWWNRLVGDEKYPDGFPGSGFGKPRTFTTHKAWKAEDKLQPSGLLGPVSIIVKRMD